MDKEELNKITETIIGAAIEVHRNLGPGLLESAYEAALAFELIERGFQVERQKELPVVYKSVRLDVGYRLDLLVNQKVIIELKTEINSRLSIQHKFFHILSFLGTRLGF